MRRFVVPLIVAMCAHGLGLANGFVGDDVPDVIEHPVVNGEASLLSILDYNYMGEPLGEGVNTLRPAATLHFAVEWRLFGGHSLGFHLVSLIWFAVLVVLVQRTFERLGLSTRDAAVGAALFAALAIHVDAVGLVANRAEVCSLVFALLSLGAVLDHRALRAVGYYAAALMFKESAFMLPAIAAWWLACERGREGFRLRQGGSAVLGLVVFAAAFLAIRTVLVPLEASVASPDNPLIGAELGERVWMPFVLLGRYIETTLAPLSLAFDYTYSAIPVNASLTRVSGWLGVAVTVAVAIPIARRSQRTLAIACGGFVLSYALFSNSVFLIVTLFAERLFLAPSFFLVAAAVCVGRSLATTVAAKRALVALASIVIASQTMISAQRTRELRSELTMLAAQVDAQPASVKGHLYYARALARRGDTDRAVWHLAIATAGRRAYPGAFSPPSLGSTAPKDALQRIPALLAPGEPPSAFWPAFAAFAAERLGPAAGTAVSEAARRAQ